MVYGNFVILIKVQKFHQVHGEVIQLESWLLRSLPADDLNFAESIEANEALMMLKY